MDFKQIILPAIVFLILAVIAAVLKGGRKSTRVRRIDFMTKNELEFWRMLVPAAAPLNVAPQVAMGALMDADSGLGRSERTTVRNGFDRQRVDFVLFDHLGEVKLLVELDDSTHRASKDALRDQRTGSAGYKTLRLRRRDASTVETLRAMVSEATTEASNVAARSAAK